MIIGIDGNEANVIRKVGISEYSFELLRQFKKFSLSNIKYHIYLKDSPLEHMPEESEAWKYEIVGPKKLWTQIGLPLHLFFEKPRPDIFFSPTHYAPRFSPIPTAISIMDLSYVHFSEMFAKKDLYQLKQWTAYSVKQAKVIFTISKSSRRDILKYYHIPEVRVVVTYPGIKIPFSSRSVGLRSKTMEELRKKFAISDKFILFVGTLQPRKNIERLIEAFASVKHQASSIKDLELVIVGKKGWLYESILEAPKKHNVEHAVKFLDFVSDDDLESLYTHAICYCLPSLYEGFGLPVLEAMQRGCPVITSNVSSLPEAGGKAALYVNPEDVNDIAKKLALIMQDGELRKELIHKGYEQVKKFSWEKTAKETLEVLQKLSLNNYS